MPKLTKKQQTLLRISKADLKEQELWDQGAHVRESMGIGMAEARLKAAGDRLELAASFLTAARQLFALGKYRDATSRGYYSAYHAIRAATFVSVGGDDHEAHSILPANLPANFPKPDVTKNNLSTARLLRNQADYDPYPKADSAFKSDAKEVIAIAERALKSSRKYVRNAT